MKLIFMSLELLERKTKTNRDKVVNETDFPANTIVKQVLI